MDTLNKLHENISALVDGELADSERAQVLAALGSAEGRAAWQAYHLIGDVLRAQARDTLRPQAAAALAARLAAEPGLHKVFDLR